MSEESTARRLEWPPSNISRLETGVRPLPIVDVAMFLATCNATGAERDRLLKLAATADDLYWVRPYFGELADPMKSLLVQEALAESIAVYEPAVIPGLQQTEQSAALFRPRRARIGSQSADIGQHLQHPGVR